MKPSRGCGTCRDRKILCDRATPTCQRCAKACRPCQGYGLRLSWPGKNSRRHATSDPSQSRSPAFLTVSNAGWINTSFDDMPAHYRLPISAPTRRSVIPISMEPTVKGGLDADEKRAFDWFIHRTSVKVPGLFTSAFWHTLVPQACSSERVVLHAALALASAHETAMRPMAVPDSTPHEPGKHQQFTIQQYNKAIKRLLPLLSDTDGGSVRVALIACMLFACIELLQKRYKSGHDHLQAGRKVLSRACARRDMSGDLLLSETQSRDLADDWLLEAFARLDLQAAMLNSPGSHVFSQHYQEHDHVPSVFSSVAQARRSLDALLCRTYKLTHESCDYARYVSPIPGKQFATTRQHIQIELASWLRTYNSSFLTLGPDMSARDAIGYQLLRTYHTMAHILVKIAANPGDELQVDKYTNHFLSIITHSREILAASTPMTVEDIKSAQCSTDFSFIIDIGIIPPLFFVAVKCRVSNVRQQAIHLLANASHQEGVWNGHLMAMAATEIARLEGNDVLRHVNHPGDLMEQAAVPSALRLHGVAIQLPDLAVGSLMLTGDRKRADGSWETLTRYYNPHHDVWSARVYTALHVSADPTQEHA